MKKFKYIPLDLETHELYMLAKLTHENRIRRGMSHSEFIAALCRAIAPYEGKTQGEEDCTDG